MSIAYEINITKCISKQQSQRKIGIELKVVRGAIEMEHG